jgi:hypothetical protein
MRPTILSEAELEGVWGGGRREMVAVLVAGSLHFARIWRVSVSGD